MGLSGSGQRQKEDNDDSAKIFYHEGENDVLIGRDKGSYSHEGSVRFRRLVTERIPSYGKRQQNPSKSCPRDNHSYNFPNIRFVIVPASPVRTKVKQALRDLSVATLQEPKSNEASYSDIDE